MLKEITQFIDDKSKIGAWGFSQQWTIGTNLFAGHVPVKYGTPPVNIPIRYLAVLENAGGAVLSDVGGVVATVPPSNPTDPNYGCTYWPKYIEKAVQLLNRAESYFVARLDAEELYEAFHQTAGWNLPPVAIGKTLITPPPIADSATVTTLRDISVFTKDDEFNGTYVSIVSGAGTDNGWVAIIDTIAASGDIRVSSWPGTQPDNTSRYIIGRQYLVCVVDAYGPPAPVGNPDEKGFFQFSTNYTWKIEETSCGA